MRAQCLAHNLWRAANDELEGRGDSARERSNRELRQCRRFDRTGDGARQVIAPGRNEAVLADLKRRFGARVVPVRLSGNETQDIASIHEAAGAPIDAVLDFLPPSADASVAWKPIMTVRPYGRAVLMGGVGMLGGNDLALPYPWIIRNLITVKGQWMYEPLILCTRWSAWCAEVSSISANLRCGVRNRSR